MRTYWLAAKRLSSFWQTPILVVLFRMLAARVFFNRGPQEFDEYRFTRKSIRRWVEFIAPAERVRLQAASAPLCSRKFEEDKLLFADYCRANALPHVPVLAVVSNKELNYRYPPGVARIDSPDALADTFRRLGSFDGFAKPIASGKGLGVQPFQVRGGALVSTPPLPDSTAMFDQFVQSSLPGKGYVIQPMVRAHAQLRCVMPGPGLGTLRVVTFLQPDQSVHIALAVLKIPAPDAPCDDERLGAQLVEVDLSTGYLLDAVGTTQDAGVTHVVPVHVETGHRFFGTQLPYWEETRALVTRAARAFCMLPALGWDIAITDDGPLLLEANWRFSAVFYEQCRDRGWAEELRRLFASIAVPKPPETEEEGTAPADRGME
jgi:hypothetical protein